MREIQVEVTAEDIAAGVADDCSRCPVARAISRAMGYDHGLGIVQVTGETVRLACFGESWGGSIPGWVSRFVRAFDNRLPVQPFDFRLEIPGWWADRHLPRRPESVMSHG
jgi:hypothetical protein